MKRAKTAMRATALAALAMVAVAIVVMNVTHVPVIAADYLVRADLEETLKAEPAAVEVADAATLTDWEYTLRLRPPKCRFVR